MNKLKTALQLFINFFKIGLFTFGGGYAMVAVIERELVERKKWISHDEFLDVVAIAESTPGPIAINSATHIGFKRCGVLGSAFATLGVVLPSFIIIFAISLIYEQFLALKYVAYAFNGIRAGVAFLIVSAGLKMFKKLEKNVFSVLFFTLTVLSLLILDFFAVNISSILFILFGGVVSVFIYAIYYIKKKKQVEKDNVKGLKEEVKGDKE